MDILQLILLGLVQGITEFLPVSSSAHLILLPIVTGWTDQGLANDIAAHLGSLFAVIIYFHQDLHRIIKAWRASIMDGKQTTDSKMAWYLVIATMPIACVALLTYEIIASAFRDPIVIASATIVFGLLLWLADVNGKRTRKIESLDLRDAFLIGLAQVLALIPGTSRSGITMTAGLMLGLDRTAAARFSFLLAIPTILLAGGHEIYRLILLGTRTDIYSFTLIFITSFVSALITIKLFLGLLERTGMLPYVIYRLFLGAVLFFIFIK